MDTLNRFTHPRGRTSVRYGTGDGGLWLTVLWKWLNVNIFLVRLKAPVPLYRHCFCSNILLIVHFLHLQVQVKGNKNLHFSILKYFHCLYFLTRLICCAEFDIVLTSHIFLLKGPTKMILHPFFSKLEICRRICQPSAQWAGERRRRRTGNAKWKLNTTWIYFSEAKKRDWWFNWA